MVMADNAQPAASSERDAAGGGDAPSVLRHAGDGGRSTPLSLEGSAWRAALQRLPRRIQRDRVTMAAGSLAYHWFLAMFPAVIAALGILTLVHMSAATLHHMEHGIAKALPPGAAGVFDGAVRAANRRATGSIVAVVIGVAVALWSATSGAAVLEQALDVAYEVPADRPFLARRLWGLPIMAVVVLVGGLGLALTVFGQPIGSAIQGAIPVGGTAFMVAWTVVRWVLTAILLSAAFSAVYYLAPNREGPRWQWVTAGGVLATAIFLLASLGFSFYVSSFGSYGKTYGSFAGVAILIFWLWLTALAVLVGGELNAELEREVAARAQGGPAPVTVDAATSEALRPTG